MLNKLFKSFDNSLLIHCTFELKLRFFQDLLRVLDAQLEDFIVLEFESALPTLFISAQELPHTYFFILSDEY